MSDWKEISLGDVIETNFSNYSSKDAWEHVHYLDTGNITEGNIDEILKLTIGEDKIPSRAKRKAANGDIVYSTVRPNQRHYGIIRNSPSNLLVSTGFTTIRAKEGADNDFIYWFLAQDSIVNYLHGIGENSTSTYPSIKSSDIESLIINLPPLPEQKAIAHILGKLDDKIELNRQMNQTLEAMAQALFKSWFVDFDPVMDNAIESGTKIPEALKAKAEKRQLVPDSKKLRQTNPDLAKLFPSAFEFNESLGKWIPDGWEFKDLNEVVTLDTTSIKPFDNPETLYRHYSIPSFDAGMKPALDLGSEIKSNKYVVKAGAILVSKLNPATRRIWFVGDDEVNDSICSTEFMQMVPVEQKNSPYLYSLFNSDLFQNEIESTVTGSTGSRQRAQPKMVVKIQVVIPNGSILESFNNCEIELLKKQSVNLKETEILTQLRDTLLPKLISGKVRVPIKMN